ncbi:SAF domain-containing protein [Paenibacillus antarcticus]|nr:SAF domain-containing protein [Paenibacillus antarcticus]
MGTLSAGGITYLIKQQAKEEKTIRLAYQSQIDEAEKRFKDQNAAKKRVIVTSKEMKAGESLTETDLKVIELPEKDVPDNMNDGIEDFIGKVLKIDASINTPLINSMLFEEGVTPQDLRIQEYNVLQLPTQLKKGQFVDVRIMFPTGQDYTILSKKKVKDLLGTTVWHEVNEFEILAMQSAIVDAYIHGAKLYEITYVDPFMQDKSIPNYPINLNVIDLIQLDPNILEKAKISMDTWGRTRIEKAMSEMDGLDITKVQNGSMMLQQQVLNDQTVQQQKNQGITNDQYIPQTDPDISGSTSDTSPQNGATMEQLSTTNHSIPQESIVQPVHAREKENEVFEQPLVNP